MNSKLFTLIALTILLILAGFTYFYKLDQFPNGVYVDEATVGYNSLSILNTGKDEYGKSYPVAFRFFGAYTPPLSVYLLLPFIKFLGLNAISIRLLSGIATMVGVLVVYLFVKNMPIFGKYTALLASMLFAFSPWVLFNARLGYEVTVGYVLFAVGSLLIWNKLKTDTLSLPGLLILSISTYAAHTERYLVPIFLSVIFVLNRKTLLTKTKKRFLLLTLLVVSLTQIPNFFLLTTNAFWVKNIAAENANIFQVINDFISQILTYYSPKELYGISSDINLQHTMPALSLFYPWMVVPYLLGLYKLYWLKKTPAGKFLIVMFLTAAIPGALSGHFISVQRILPIIVPNILITVLGLELLIKRLGKLVFIPVLVALIIFSVVLLWRSYFVFLPGERAMWWNHGYEEIAQIANQNPGTKYLVDNTREGAIYMQFLFHLKYPPVNFQKNFDEEYVTSYYTNPPYTGNYEINNIQVRPVIWEKDIFVDQVLVGDELLLSPDQAKEHFLDKVIEVKDATGKVLLLGYKTNPERKIEDNKRKLRNLSQ